MLRMTMPELEQFIAEAFPQAQGHAEMMRLSEQELELRMPYRDAMLRPGGTISGPALMSLADTGAYYLILANIGPVALAVTTSLNINFMRKPRPEDVFAVARMLKLGRQLAVVEVNMRSASSDEIVAQATVTYSIPPTKA
jgi:uncharacterized protein (TIGR00369 family)